MRQIVLAAALVALVPVAACGDGGSSPGGEPADAAAHVDAMAAEHAHDEPVPSPAVTGEADTAGVTTETVVYHRAGETAVEGFLARPENAGAAPGVILVHEWWGLNDNVREMARRFAAEGYVALAVDLYAGRVADDPERARAIMQETMEDPAAAVANLRAAQQYLSADAGAPRTAVVGWCFGGGWALQAALAIPELDAAVMYYGRTVAEREELARLETPLLGHFGAEDEGIPVAGVREMERTLAELGKQATVHVYEGAGHAFANPSGTRYEAEAAELAWQRTKAFLAEHLRPATP